MEERENEEAGVGAGDEGRRLWEATRQKLDQVSSGARGGVAVLNASPDRVKLRVD